MTDLTPATLTAFIAAHRRIHGNGTQCVCPWCECPLGTTPYQLATCPECGTVSVVRLFKPREGNHYFAAVMEADQPRAKPRIPPYARRKRATT